MPKRSIGLWIIVMRKDLAAFAKYCRSRSYNEVRAVGERQKVPVEMLEEMIRRNEELISKRA